MKTKFNGFAKMPKAIWKSRGDWFPTYVVNQQKQDGIEYQHYMLDSQGKLVCAGVTKHERMNQATANQIFRVWRRWRTEYDTRFTGVGDNYPAKHASIPTQITVFPVGNPELAQYFSVGGAL